MRIRTLLCLAVFAMSCDCSESPPKTTIDDVGLNNLGDSGVNNANNTNNQNNQNNLADMGSDTSVDMQADAGPLCGNMVIDPGETCDPPGSCNVDCDDQNDCTVDSLAGSAATCTAACDNTLIEVCVDDDSCCPAACNANTDNDCVAFCGNGVVEGVEVCDGNCPTACDDNDVCTNDVLLGDPTMCDVACGFDPIIVCDLTADGCCPTNCNANNDADCQPMCGNGVVEGLEICDGNCPVACDDGIACTDNVLSGSAGNCDAVCTYPDVIVCDLNVSDNCCPMNCNAGDDVDCQAMCGNNIVEPGETCDPVATCPVDCDDLDACTADNQTGSPATCDIACSNLPITTCSLVADGCCPVGLCNANNDADCTPICDNGAVEAGETCDPIATCPADCDDLDACTNDVQTGSPATCDIACTNTPISACIDNDGCCPGPPCDATNDSDCVATPTAFRVTSIQLRDAHAFALILGFLCIDITSNLNTELNNAIGGDSDNDGFLDLSLIAVQRPSDPGSAVTLPMDLSEGECTAPAAGTTCDQSGAVSNTDYTNQIMGTCSSPIAGTTSGYTPAITNSTGPCFSASPTSLTLNLGGILVPLQGLVMSATWNGNPSSLLTNGLLYGFISETDAENVIIPNNIPQVGGQTLASLFPGGNGNCNGGDDRDLGPDGITSGWWIYFNFTGEAVNYSGM